MNSHSSYQEAMYEAKPKQHALHDWRELIAPIMRRAEVFVSGRHWIVEVCFLAVLFSMIFTGGVDDILYDARVRYDAGYFLKIEHPLEDVSKHFPPNSHDAKLNFRLTVPVVLHWLPLRVVREPWFLPGLTVCAICGLLVLCCLFTYRVTGDRVCGLLITLGVASTYIGTFYTTRCYDAIALCQLLIAMLPGVPCSVRGLLVFTAAFTDERAFVAAPLLLFADMDGGSENTWGRITYPPSLVVIIGMAGYCLGRLLLTEYAGLASPIGNAGLQSLVVNARYWHSGAWFGLGGGWLLVGLSMLFLWQNGQKLKLKMFACAIGAPILLGLMVLDVVRSTAYTLPALLVALTVLRKHATTSQLRAWCLAAFILSIVAGDFCVFPNPWPSQPLIVKWLCEVIHAFLPGGGLPQ